MKLVENTDKPELLDARWFPRIAAIHEGVPYRFRTSSFNSARAEFLSGETDVPRFEYPYICDEKIEQKRTDLKQLMDELLAAENAPAEVVFLYKERIEEKLMILEYVHLACRLVSNKSKELAARYRELGGLIYSTPSAELFDRCSTNMSEKILGRTATTSEFIDLLTNIPSRELQSVQGERPRQEPLRPTISYAEIETAFNDALTRSGIKGWVVVQGDMHQYGFEVQMKKKRIVVPNNTSLATRKLERTLSTRSLAALVAHEMTHVIRYENGLCSRLRLLSSGLAGSARGEEGVALYRERKINPVLVSAAERLYFAAGLATGIDRSGNPRTFHEVFEIIKGLYVALDKDATMNTDHLAFGLCFKLFRGAPLWSSGCFFNKQIFYYEGQCAIESLLQEQPEAESWFAVGRFDPTRPDQVSALKKLGVIH